MKIIIPMAGKSIRFFKAGYKTPKYFLKNGDKYIIENVLNMFNDNDEYYLIFSYSQKKKYQKKIESIKKLKKKIFITYIDDHNKGPVNSIILADFKFYDANVIISYNDFLVDWNYDHFLRVVSGYDGSIVSFKGFHPTSFSGTLFCYLKSKNKLITNLREKKSFTYKPHNESASTGIYYFDKYEYFLKNAKKLIKNNNMAIKNEYYVSQVYLGLIKQKKNILDYAVDSFIGLGTPRDYEIFIFWKNYFRNNEKN